MREETPLGSWEEDATLPLEANNRVCLDFGRDWKFIETELWCICDDFEMERKEKKFVIDEVAAAAMATHRWSVFHFLFGPVAGPKSRW